ncbi:MAG TPA: hypothetical protein VGN95_18485 [Pyrinomonadaceae bacterium]|nr:hypothetical protein [Pyrinomonadaceae bacterium]
MNIKTDKRMRITLAVALTLLIAGVSFYATKSFSSVTSSDLDYFKGNWVVTMRSNPKESFSWTVKEDLNGSWMAGVVEKDGEKVSTDFWRQGGKKIERFAFTSGSTFVKIEGLGWESDRLVLSGIASDKTGETKIRETITKINERQFHALWEKESSDGKWIIFADEICTRS